MKTAHPNLPKMEPRIPSAKPKHNTKVEDRAKQKQMLDELLLLKQIIVESKSFRRLDNRERQEHQDGEK
jgi:hypothetical protein